jgi:phospholipase/lecithinase/hemolysin
MIRLKLPVYAILTCLVLSPAAMQAANPHFSAIYVFGDSYCDVGNLFTATGGALPAPQFYDNGRFSNGPIWVEHVASAWGLTMKPALQGGTDYAFGGAEVTADIPLGGGAVIPSVPHQVALYLNQHGGKADPNAVYILEGGGNDIINAAGSGSPQQLAYQIAAGIAGIENQLRHAGARNFLVPNLFDLSITPVGRTNAAFNTAAALATNKALGDMLEVEGLFPGVTITHLDSLDLFQAIVTDTNHMGFTDVVNACFDEVALTVCTDPVHLLFWDDIHPTVFGHSFLAVTVEALYAH